MEKFFGRIFWETFLGGTFWEDFLGGNSLFTLLKLFEYARNLFVSQDFGFCQDFGLMEKEGRKEGRNFRSLEVRRKLIALKNGNFKTRDFSPLIERVLAGVES